MYTSTITNYGITNFTLFYSTRPESPPVPGCPLIYDRTESTVTSSYAYAFSVLYIAGLACSLIFDGSLAALILWIPELRRIRINFFVFAMAVGNILSSLMVTVAFCNMAFHGKTNPFAENVMTRAYTFCNAFALYSLVAMCFEALRYLSLNPNVTVKHEIRRTRVRHCACHLTSWCILLAAACMALLLAGYPSFDQAILGSAEGYIPAVRSKMVVFAVFHAYLPLTSMGVAMAIAVSFWWTRGDEAPRYMEVVVSERRRGVKLIMLVAGIHILFALPHAGVVTYYLHLLYSFPLNPRGCVENISYAKVLSHEPLLIFHRFTSLLFTVSLNVNGVLILVLSKRINKSLRLTFHNALIRCGLRPYSCPLPSAFSTQVSEIYSVRNAFRIGELGGMISRSGCSHPYQNI